MFWETFYTECKRQNTSPNAVCKEIGLSNATATGWKNGTLPKADVLCKIADYLNVSVDSLLGRTAPNSQELFGDAERRIIAAFAHLGDNQKWEIIGRAELLAEMNQAAAKEKERKSS